MVDLPAPLGPRKPWTSPVATSRSSPSSARKSPNVLTRPEISIAGLLMVHRLHMLHEVVNRENRQAAEFVERFALLLDEAGMPRMPARVFAAILADDAGG